VERVRRSLNKEIMKRIRTTTFVILTLSIAFLFVYIITQETSMPTTLANATTTNATRQASSSASDTGEDTQTGASSSSRLISNATKTSANQTAEDIPTDDLLDRATRKFTTPGVQSNPDEALEKAKQQYR
jgi:uncharacterized membrane protein YdfJ with MMPL/SSD domain